MKKHLSIFFLLLLILFYGKAQSVTNSIKLTDGKKTKELFLNQGHFLEYIYPASKDTTVFKFRHIQGSLTKIKNDSLILFLTEDDLYQRNPDCSQIEIKKSYKNPTEYLAIKLDQLSQINYESKNSNNWLAFGACSILIGTFTSFILAPLISINYKTGQINSPRYITCASIGLGLITIGIPIVATAKEKKYYLEFKHAPKKSKIWKIK